MQTTVPFAPYLQVPQVVTEGAAPAGAHGCVVQTGRHTLRYPLVPELHPALGVVLAVLGPLFSSCGRGCRCLLLAPHETVWHPRQRSGQGDRGTTHSLSSNPTCGQDLISRSFPPGRGGLQSPPFLPMSNSIFSSTSTPVKI